MDGACQRRAVSEGSLPLTGQVEPPPSTYGGVVREGGRTSAQTQVVGEGKGVMLKGYHERIRRHDLKVRGEEQQVKWGRVIWRYYRRV